MPLVSQMGLGGYLLELLRVADYKNGNPTFDLKAAFEEKAVKENVIIIGSIHGTRDTSVIEDLPSAESLKAAGFTSVTILIEGLPRRAAAYSPEEVNGVDDIATSYTTDVPGREFLARLKANHPAAYELLKSGKARFHPDSDAVVTKAKSWSSTLPVKFHSIGE